MPDATEAATFSFDRETLGPFAEQLKPAFMNARPFQHAVIDGLFPDAVLGTVLDEFPAPEQAPWKTFDRTTEVKMALFDTAKMGPATRNLLAECNGQVFVEFLEQLTGINGLIPDPHYAGGGLHQIRQGGFLKVHADFNRHERLQLDRRLNVLIYLNRDWDETYGGSLELWNQDMSAAEQTILPVFNRLVVFSTTSTSFHGHPEPLTCPPERARRSLALYYYTSRPPGAAGGAHGHDTLFQIRPGETVHRSARDVARRWSPEPLRDWVRSKRR